MTDKELLELAAKAAGWDSFDWLADDNYMNVYDTKGHQFMWNPLTDDGDALRLAVKLKMIVELGVARSCAGEFSGFDEPCDYAATRRAIVRAAAEIGKTIGETK